MKTLTATITGMKVEIDLKKKTINVSDAGGRNKPSVELDATSLSNVVTVGEFGISGKELEDLIRTQPTQDWERS